MPKQQYQISNGGPPSGVERACEIAKALFQQARGQHETDQQTVDAIARRAQLSPSVVRRFLQPSRRPKDVSLGIWTRLVRAYHRLLNQQLEELKLEILRLEALDPDGRALLGLLDKAKAIESKIRGALPEIPAAEDE